MLNNKQISKSQMQTYKETVGGHEQGQQPPHPKSNHFAYGGTGENLGT